MDGRLVGFWVRAEWSENGLIDGVWWVMEKALAMKRCRGDGSFEDKDFLSKPNHPNNSNDLEIGAQFSLKTE